jgi:hypothetical protein
MKVLLGLLVALLLEGCGGGCGNVLPPQPSPTPVTHKIVLPNLPHKVL